MSNNNWLSELKAGDKVVINNYGHREIHFVEKITPSGMIKVNGSLYNKDGSKRGASYGFGLSQCTPEIEKEIAEIRFIKNVIIKIKNVKALTFDQAAAINRILSE